MRIGHEREEVGETSRRAPDGVPTRASVLTAPLSFALLGLLSHAGLLVKASAFQFAKQTFSGELLFGDFQRFLDVVVEDLDFHPVDFRLSQAK
jgi:hypothetical protein